MNILFMWVDDTSITEVTYITESHIQHKVTHHFYIFILLHCLDSETAIHNKMTYDICYMHMKVTALTIHFVTCISRVLISQKYSPFLHIYNLVSCCLTCATVMYITMLWMNLLHVDAWYEWSCLGFVVFIYITIYWHRFDIIIYYGNKAVYISWIDAKKLAHNFV